MAIIMCCSLGYRTTAVCMCHTQILSIKLLDVEFAYNSTSEKQPLCTQITQLIAIEMCQFHSIEYGMYMCMKRKNLSLSQDLNLGPSEL